MVGLLQFVVPVLQFLFAWLLFDEPLPLSRWIGFAIVWAALVVFATDMLRSARASRAVAREAARTAAGEDRRTAQEAAGAPSP
jgi:chloramphenicol-sensitive protein RarD